MCRDVTINNNNNNSIFTNVTLKELTETRVIMNIQYLKTVTIL